MIPDTPIAQPLVSVIIPCYNHGEYLNTAIESILTQSYPHVEIFIVDDGSTDNTKLVAEKFTTVNYIYQSNQGLSAARNAGIDKCKGQFVVFLDADDWLLADAIKINLAYFKQDPDVAFVSGAHVKVIESRNLIEEKKIIVDDNHYQRLLMGNFIAMHAVVMYQRWVFNQFHFDTGLFALEDYDMYLKITRKHKVIHHQQIIAAYRIHQHNMSGNIPLMLESALLVLKRQEPMLLSQAEYKSYRHGLKYWKDYYSGSLYRNLVIESWPGIKKRKQDLKMLFLYNAPLYLKLLFKKIINVG